MPEEQKAPVAEAIYEGHTQKTPYYVSTIDLNVANIDKNDKIYGGASTKY